MQRLNKTQTQHQYEQKLVIKMEKVDQKIPCEENRVYQLNI